MRFQGLDFVFVSVILLPSAGGWRRVSRFFVYLVCTAKSAFVGLWVFSVFGKSITYLFSAPPGGSIPSLATIISTIFNNLLRSSG
jgi:hypothetical protein